MPSEEALRLDRMEPSVKGKYRNNMPFQKERSNLMSSNLNYDECSNGSGIDEADFKTLREDSEKMFARNQDECCSTFSFQEVLDTLNTKRVTRKSLLSHVELDAATGRLKLSVDRGNVRAKYGYDVGKEAFLYPEEALYLLETGKAEIFCEYVSLSIQRARSLLLISQREGNNNSFCNCTVEEFLVYKHLSRMGYCLYRYVRGRNHITDESMTNSLMEDADNVKMEEDNGMIIDEGSNVDRNSEEIDDIIDLDAPADKPMIDKPNQKGLKRTYSASSIHDNITSESDEFMESELEYWNQQVCIASMDEDSCLHGTKVEPGGYTVDEADSDVEIVDEVIYRHGGVEIQEIAHTVGCLKENYVETFDEPVASTSKGVPSSQVVVDLVSSDDEEQDMKSFGNRIWSKFIPNSKLMFGVPPSTLIPQNMPDNDKIYELDLKDKSDVSDLELEFLVDEVSLNDDRHGVDSADNPHSFNISGSKSWKDWRQSVFREARNVMDDSLLASSEYINGEAATKRLFLWDDAKNESQTKIHDGKIVFEMYGPVGQGFSRLKASEEIPSYYIFITRHDEPIPDLGIIGTSVDGVPNLIAIVCDSGENDIVFITADRSPLIGRNMFKFKRFPLPSSPLYSSVWYTSYTSNQNYYEVLGISKQSSSEEIKRAYYEQSKKYHPDKKEGNQDRFREITSAYEVLGNHRLRKMYDRGLISDTNKSIYTADTEQSTESSTSNNKNTESISMPHLDQWSKEQYSQTFARSQRGKAKQNLRQRQKTQDEESFSSQGVFWLLGSVLLGVGIYMERMRSYHKKDDPKS
ncbi:unnamed protein product [Orchesella dallaii]|uniref:J domain-containing protein n=1 Tax=Orchesella dallaii TaxID=48710 RepID=A0ABP1QEM8_9HEXA